MAGYEALVAASYRRGEERRERERLYGVVKVVKGMDGWKDGRMLGITMKSESKQQEEADPGKSLEFKPKQSEQLLLYWPRPRRKVWGTTTTNGAANGGRVIGWREATRPMIMATARM